MYLIAFSKEIKKFRVLSPFCRTILLPLNDSCFFIQVVAVDKRSGPAVTKRLHVLNSDALLTWQPVLSPWQHPAPQQSGGGQVLWRPVHTGPGPVPAGETLAVKHLSVQGDYWCHVFNKQNWLMAVWGANLLSLTSIGIIPVALLNKHEKLKETIYYYNS